MDIYQNGYILEWIYNMNGYILEWIYNMNGYIIEWIYIRIDIS